MFKEFTRIFTVYRKTVKKMRKFLHLTLFVNLLTLFVNCSTKYVPIEVVKLDSVRYVDVRRDSIHVLDSVIVTGKNDTVYLTRWRIEYREALRVDTFVQVKSDTTVVTKEVEKRLTKVQELAINIGNGVLWALPIMIALYLLYRKLLR